MATKPAVYAGEKAFVVTPSDSVNLKTSFGVVENSCRALWIGGAGNIVVVFEDDTTCLFSGVSAGTLLPIRAKRINTTSTTATLIVAIY